MKRRWTKLGLALAAVGLIAAACGDSGGTKDGSSNGRPAPTTCKQVASAAQLKNVDFNGDGKLTIGVATPGPRNDGAYYQTLVDCVNRLTAANKGNPAIIVDNIPAADAATQLENLAKQNPDIIMVGASEIGKPLADLAKKYDKIFWYCNCGAGQPANPNYAQSQDDGGEISLLAGYATGLLLKQNKKTTAAFIGNNNLNFEVNAFESFKYGIKLVDASYDAKYFATGSFNDAAKATEAYNTAKGQGVGAVYPYLGGAHEAVVKLAAKDKIVVMSAGASDACKRTDLKYDIAVKFDGGDYLNALFSKLLDAQFKEDSVYKFKVGVDPEPGADICKPTADQTKALDAVKKDIAAGKYAKDLGAIAGKAFGG